MNDWSPPEEFDGYRLTRLIGRGGMGSVYLAQDTLLERPVAVKFISAPDANDSAHRRFLLEAKAIARLSHPNVVAVYRVGHIDRVPYLVSEFVRGVDLEHVPTPMPWRKVLEIGLGIARGLAAAHSRGVVHRDIKPANAILSESGDAKLLDFGIAKLIEGRSESYGRATAGAEDSAEQDGSESARSATMASMAPRSAPIERIEPGLDASQVTTSCRPAPALRSVGASGDETAIHDVVAFVPETVNHRVAEPTSETVAYEVEAWAGEPVARAAEASVGRAATAHLTRTGAIIGTPAYLSPELWKGDPATFTSDVYAFGALLYRLSTGRLPHAGRSLEELRERALNNDATPLEKLVTDANPDFAAVVNRCLARDPRARYADGNEVRAALAQLTPEARAAIVPDGNPYRGLQAFDAEHQGVYFGRDSEIRTILERLVSEPSVLVVGDSGVGKSSLCRAGVLSRVNEWLADGRVWSSVILVPGEHPVSALANALAPHLDLSVAEIERMLREETGSIVRELRRSIGTKAGIVLMIDQFEELVTLADAREAQAISELFGWLGTVVPGVRLLATLRGDFLSRLAALLPTSDAVARSLYFLRPLTPARIREVITGPARVMGVDFESEKMVQSLVDATAQTGGALPLLQFALAELWEARDRTRRLVTVAALEALGGVTGALTRHADDVLSRMLPAERVAARRVLLRLVTADGTRARRTGADLGADPDTRAALEALVQGRLVVARDTPEGAAYEIAHEALLQAWPTLADWLSADEGSRIVRERLARAVQEWERLRHAPECLWSGRQIAEINAEAELSPREAAFVQASRRALSRRRWWRGALLAGLPLVLVSTYAGVTIAARNELGRRVDLELSSAKAELASARALRRELEKLEERAFDKFDKRDSDAAEAVWAEALTKAEQVEPLFRRSSQKLEGAMMLDPNRPDVRAALADVLFDRSLFADQRHRTEERNELLQRLALYDDGERLMQRWSAPARLTLSTEPACSIVLKRYPDHGPSSVDVGSFTGRVYDLELDTGSYVAVISGPGRAEVRLPLSLERGERLELRIEVPTESEVPRGFVYVPPGRFWLGSAAEETQRRGFFHTVPLHRASTGGYLIARHETTFGDWLEYLRALPPAQRSAASPQIKRGGFQGALSLEAISEEVWQLTFQAAGKEFRVKTGEPIVYTARKRRAAQDWSKLPVVGISVADAERYTAWLSTSGRVPGARLCSELEWERAARGADSRSYPHGNVLTPDDANFDQTYGKDPEAMGPDEVGSHPNSRSPYGLDDMAGNAWEWTRAALSRDEYAARGGSFYYASTTTRVYNREVPEPSFRDISVGMRVCADPPRR